MRQSAFTLVRWFAYMLIIALAASMLSLFRISPGWTYHGRDASPATTTSREQAGQETNSPASSAPAGHGTGCAPASRPLGNPDFVPIGVRFGYAEPPPITAIGRPVESLDDLRLPVLPIPDRPIGLDHELVVLGQNEVESRGPAWVVVSYFAPSPLSGSFVDVLDQGGVMVVQKAAAGQDADLVAAELDDSRHGYTRILIGDHDAVVHEADPVSRDDLRPWHIYWSDGVRDWEVVGNADPVALIGMARSIYCGSPS